MVGLAGYILVSAVYLKVSLLHEKSTAVASLHCIVTHLLSPFYENWQNRISEQIACLSSSDSPMKTRKNSGS